VTNPNDRTFCIGPWSEIRIKPDGSLNYCHTAAWPESSKDNIASIDLDQYFSGSTVKSVRDTIMSGGCVSTCQKCYNNDTIIDNSYRRRRNIQMAIFPGKDFAKSLHDSDFYTYANDPDHKPFFYNISVSNLCNLACVMCNEDWSSRLASEFKRIGIRTNNQSTLLDWTRDDNTWNKFMQHMLSNQQIVCVHFQGGEPLLHKRVKEFVNQCVEQNHVDFHFTTVTNGTVYESDFVEKLTKFRSVQIEISIESFAPSNDYVRYPSNHPQVLGIIEQYLQHRTDKFDVVIRTVPQLLTVLDYAQLIEKCLELDLVIDSNIIHSPEFMHPGILPDDIKSLAISRLEKCINQITADHGTFNNINIRNRGFVKSNLKQNAELVIKLLQQPRPANAEQLIQQAKQFFKKIDQSRGITLDSYCPEVARWLYAQ